MSDLHEYPPGPFDDIRAGEIHVGIVWLVTSEHVKPLNIEMKVWGHSRLSPVAL